MLEKILRKCLTFAEVAWGQIVVAICALISIRLLTELMSPTEFGIAMLSVGVIGLVEGVLTVPIAQVLMATLPHEPASQRSIFAVSNAIRFLFWYRYLFIVYILAVGLLFTILPTEIVLCAILLPIHIASEATKQAAAIRILLYRSRNEFSRWSAIDAVLSLIVISSAVGIANGGAISYVCGYFLARIICCVLIVSLVDGYRSWLDSIRAINRPPATDLKQTFLPIAAMAPVGWMSAFADRYIIGLAVGAGPAGIYAASAGLVGRPFVIATATLSNFFRPEMYRAVASPIGIRSPKEVQTKWARTALFGGAFMTAAAIVVAAPAASLILAPEYRTNATVIMPLLAAAQTFSIVSHSYDNLLLSGGRGKVLLQLQLLSAVVPIAIMPGFAYLYGIVGVAGSRLISEIVRCAILHISCNWKR